MKLQAKGYETGPEDDDFLSLGAIISKCIQHLRSYVVVLAVFLLLALVYVITAQPMYTATALVGTAHTISTLGGGSLSAGASLIGTLSGSTDEDQKFDEFTQVLTSNDLAKNLANKEGFLPLIFYQNWDSSAHRWKKKNSIIFAAKGAIKSLLHMPVKQRPDADDLAHYLDRHLNLRKVMAITSSTLGGSTPLVSVSFTYKDPKVAEHLLGVILDTADGILRDQKRHDVGARIKYLETLVPTVTSAEQKEALISVLSQQLQLMSIIKADSRYSSTLVDAPYSSSSPTSPSVLFSLVVAVFLSIMAWGALIFLLPADHIVLRWLRIPWWRGLQRRRPLKTGRDVSVRS